LSASQQQVLQVPQVPGVEEVLPAGDLLPEQEYARRQHQRREHQHGDAQAPQAAQHEGPR